MLACRRASSALRSWPWPAGSFARSPPCACLRLAAPAAVAAVAGCWATAAGPAAAAAAGDEDFEEVPPTFDAEHYPDGINSNFVNDKPTAEVVATFTDRFENPETRDIARAWPQLVALVKQTLPLEGATVADIGAGTGLFTQPFVDAVGENGAVKSVELSPHFAQHLKEMSASRGYSNDAVEVIQCTDKACNLAPASIDVAFICDVYHHLEYPRSFMRSLRKAIKPGGHVVLIDFHRIPEKITSHPPGWVLVHVRAGQEVFRKEVLEAGFSLVAEPDCTALEENYVMIFQNPAPALPELPTRELIAELKSRVDNRDLGTL